MSHDIFQNSRGVHTLDPVTGLMKSENGSAKLFIGSVHPQTKIDFFGHIKELGTFPRDIRAGVYLSSIVQCTHDAMTAYGFSPEFLEGYRPLGIVCAPQEVRGIASGKIYFSENFQNRIRTDKPITVELGSPITEVYRQLAPHERAYEVF